MIFVDTNILVDLALDGRRFKEDAKLLFELCAIRNIEMMSSVLCVGTFCYLLESHAKLGNREIKGWLLKLSKLIQLVKTENSILREAGLSNMRDTEDAILYYTAVANNCKFFITQNIKDFSKTSEIPVYTPKQMIAHLS